MGGNWPDYLFFGPWSWIGYTLVGVGILVFIVNSVRKLWPVAKGVVGLIDMLGGLPDRLNTIDKTLAAQNTSLAQINDKLSNDNTRIIQLQARDELGRFKKEES